MQIDQQPVAHRWILVAQACHGHVNGGVNRQGRSGARRSLAVTPVGELIRGEDQATRA